MQTDNYRLKDTDTDCRLFTAPAITIWSLIALVQNTRHVWTFLLRSDLPQPDPRHTGRTGHKYWSNIRDRERPGLVPLHKEEEAGQ